MGKVDKHNRFKCRDCGVGKSVHRHDLGHPIPDCRNTHCDSFGMFMDIIDRDKDEPYKGQIRITVIVPKGDMIFQQFNGDFWERCEMIIK